ncbi:hypothetical protein SD80_006030 [Scytonema tolypothrichoides VB-61278]|nr:hypothetical protein SD80_006030 [Scytonema tolypothrichoides VB-61278]
MPRLSAAAYLGRDHDSIRKQMRADNKALELLMRGDRILFKSVAAAQLGVMPQILSGDVVEKLFVYAQT